MVIEFTVAITEPNTKERVVHIGRSEITVTAVTVQVQCCGATRSTVWS